MIIEWQAPIIDNIATGEYTIHPNSKIHCYVDGNSICGGYYMAPESYSTTREEEVEEWLKNKRQNFCKKCLKKYDKMFTNHL